MQVIQYPDRRSKLSKSNIHVLKTTGLSNRIKTYIFMHAANYIGETMRPPIKFLKEYLNK